MVLKATKRKCDDVPKVTKAKKVNATANVGKNLSEVQNLNSQLKTLERKHEALQIENKKHIDMIMMLEETVKILEKNSKVEQKAIGVQTEDPDIMRCNECEYPAEDIIDLGEHMYEFHTENPFYNISCYYCGDDFKAKNDLMKHRKIDHEEKVNLCNLFLEGICVFGEECWHSHKNETSKSLPEYWCRICAKVFKVRFDFMKHRKEKHIEMIPICRDADNGTCQFGKENCWFNHNDIETSKENENFENTHKINQEVIDKIFDMMEKCTQRIMEIEKITQLQKNHVNDK